MYKFIHTGFAKYFASYLSTYHNTYNTRSSCSSRVLQISLMFRSFNLEFTSPLKQFGFSFAFDAPTAWNLLPEDIRASPTIASFRKQLKTISVQRFILLSSFSLMASLWCRPISVPGFSILHTAFVLLQLRVHNSVEIKCYKSQIRIRIRTPRSPIKAKACLNSVTKRQELGHLIYNA